MERIFRMAADGIGPYTIAWRLSGDKIEKPSYYQARNDIGPYKNRCNLDTPYAWRGVTIQRMIEKPEYMGDTVNFRTTTESYKTKKQIINSPEDVLIFKDTHEAIVDRKT